MTMAHFLPKEVKEADISVPMYEPPIMTTLSACSASARMASALPNVRR
jgi:hypothetical protein